MKAKTQVEKFLYKRTIGILRYYDNIAHFIKCFFLALLFGCIIFRNICYRFKTNITYQVKLLELSMND